MNGKVRAPTQKEWERKKHGHIRCDQCEKLRQIYVKKLDWSNRFDTYVEDACIPGRYEECCTCHKIRCNPRSGRCERCGCENYELTWVEGKAVPDVIEIQDRPVPLG